MDGGEPGLRVCALGDLMLDVVVRLETPLSTGGDVPAETRAGAGGQAANVAAWTSALGGHGRFLGKRADDDAGAALAAEVERHGVELRGPCVAGRTGVVVSIVDASGERSMASDRGVATELRPDEVDPAWLDDCRTLHVSGYALAREPIAGAAERAAALARERGVEVSADVSAATLVDRDFRRRLTRLAPDVLFANEDEQAALAGHLDARSWVVKRGARGAVFARDGERLELAAAAADVVDSTGAGDALAAGFLLGGSLADAAERAMAAAARCVSKLGSMP